jgi:hypothetical protein
MKKRIASTLGGAVATGSLPMSVGCMDWRVIAGAAAVGAVGGLFGVNVAGRARRAWVARKPPTVE